MNSKFFLMLAGSVVLSLLPLMYIHKRLVNPNSQHLTDDYISALQDYLRVPTAHPNPHYDKALAFLKARAQHDGFDYQEVPLPSGHTAAIITYKGSDPSRAAIALNHHMDVVPAPNVDEWTTHPYEAHIHNGLLIARGVQDMKGVGMAHYFAMKALKDRGIKPLRTIHLFAVPDEETGGFKGTKEFINTDTFKALGIGYILDEGRTELTHLQLKVDERKPLQVRITCKGDLAHGSRLNCLNAVHELVQFLNNIAHEHEEQKQVREIQPGLLRSMNITSLNAGYTTNGNAALNIVPDQAQATIDIRVPPTMRLSDTRALLDKYASKYPHLDYKVEATVEERPQSSPSKTPLYKALEKTITHYNIKVEPHVSEGASDLRYYLKMGIDGIGFTPFLVVDNIHGTNESVPVTELIRGKEILTTFLESFCC